MTEHAKRRLYALVALLIAGGALGWMSLGSMGEDIVYYWSPTELSSKGDAALEATVRLGGMVEKGSVVWSPESQHLAFRVTDGSVTVSVEGKGAPPQMFREGIGVVVEGKLGADGLFHTDSVMVKHNNEYRPPEEGERPEDMYKTLAQEGA
jgi:cytochrome c-type biogenesis protein CcmE